MTEHTDQTEPYGAVVRLRGRAGPLPVGVFWPPDRRRRRRLVVALDPHPERARALCTRTGRIVLATAGADPPTLDDFCDLVAWAGGHGAELGAVPGEVLVAPPDPATEAAAATVAELRRRAGAEGPRLAVLDSPAADVDYGPPRSTY